MQIWNPSRLSLLAATAFVGACAAPDPLSAVGGAAQSTCNQVFVSGMPDSAFDRFTRQTTELLLWRGGNDIQTWVNRTEESVLAVVQNDGVWYGSTAIYREGLGCTVLVDKTIAEVKAQDIGAPNLGADLPAGQRWPLGTAGGPPLGTAGALDVNTYAAVDYIVEDELYGPSPVNTFSVAIAHHGELIYERYLAEPGDEVQVTPETPILGYSMSKTVTALGMGILHRLENRTFELESPMLIPEWQTPENKGDFQAATYSDFLRQRSGMAWNEENPTQENHNGPMFFKNGDSAAYAASRPQTSAPGTVFNYSTGNTMLIMRELSENLLPKFYTPARSGSQATQDFFAEELFGPANIRSASIQMDEAGNVLGGGFMSMTTRDWLRLGQLVLDGGNVNGTQVVPSDWIDWMTGGYVKRDDEDKYGFQTWVKQLEVSDGVFIKVVYFQGLLGQRMAIVPSEELVLLRLGSTTPHIAIHGHIERILVDILPLL